MQLHRRAINDAGSPLLEDSHDEIFSLEECRRIDPSLAALPDAELAAIVESLSALAELAVEDCIRMHGPGSKYPPGVVHLESDSPTMKA